jgi:hypothetical protein
MWKGLASGGWRGSETENRIALGAVGGDDEHALVYRVIRFAGDDHYRSHARHG